MEEKRIYTQQETGNADLQQTAGRFSDQVIPVIEEHATVHKIVVETGKVNIHKSVTEEKTAINLPVINESYNIERVAVNKVYDTPPPSMRYEGEVMVIPVMREVTVVQKRYEVVEELRITRQLTETPLVQEITLRKENVKVVRTAHDQQEGKEA